MKKKEEVGLASYVGQRLTLFCLNYIYTGKVIAVTDESVVLDDASIVYETGALTDSNWKDAQKLPRRWNVKVSCVESFGILK